MSHSVVFVFLLAVAELSTVDSQKSSTCEKSFRKKGWKGICFGDQNTLRPRESCESIVYNTTASECPGDEACCIDCDKQTRLCDQKHSGSVGMFKLCNHCPNALVIGKPPRPGSGCVCCKECKRKPWCKRKGGHCITELDPIYNKKWCTDNPDHPNGRIKYRGCMGNGCWCCVWD